MKKIITISTLLLTVLFFGLSNQSDAQNLVQNPGYESWTAGQPDVWTTDGGSITLAQNNSNTHGGTSSCEAVFTSTSNQYLISNTFSVTPGDPISVSMFAYDNDPAGRTRLCVIYDAGSNVYGSYSSDQANWQEITYGGTVPAGATNAIVQLRFYDVSAGWDGDCLILLDDVSFTVAIPPPPTQITDLATLRAQAVDNTVYQLNSEVVLTFQQGYRNQKFVQDGTAGILIDDAPGVFTTVYNDGDGITGIIGTLSSYNGMLQFVPQIDAGAATSAGNTIEPANISATEFTSNFEAYEGQLVKIINLTFADAGTNFSNGQVYAATDANGASLNFRTSFYSVDYIGTAIPAGENIVVGIANDRNNPYLTARNAADFGPYVPVIPLNSMGIIFAGLLLAAVVVIRKGRLF